MGKIKMSTRGGSASGGKKIEYLLLGVLSASGALIVEIFFANIFLILGWTSLTSEKEILFSGLTSFNYLLLFFILVEEAFKLLTVYKIHKKATHMDLMVGALIAGFGFSFVEIILTTYNYSAYSSLSFSMLLQLFLLHTSLFGLIAYFFAKSKTTFGAILKSTPLILFFHFYFNLMVSLSNPFTNIILFSLIVILILINIWNFFEIKTKLAS